MIGKARRTARRTTRIRIGHFCGVCRWELYRRREYERAVRQIQFFLRRNNSDDDDDDDDQNESGL